MQRLVVIGGSGFLGRSLLARAVDWDRVSVDRVSAGANLSEGVREIVAEAQDGDALRDACRSADVVWIRAGLLGGATSIAPEKAQDYLTANTDLVRRVLASLDEVGVRRVVFDSSEQVWGTSGDLERQRANGEPFAGNFYGASKLIAEKLLQHWALAVPDRSVQIFRYSRVRRALTSDVIYHMARACVEGRNLRVVGNPAHRISFVHVNDVIEANLAALALAPHVAVYQVSADRPYALFELAQLVREVAGAAVRVEFDAAPGLSATFEPFVTGMEWEESAQRLGILPRWSVAAMVAETLSYPARELTLASAVSRATPSVEQRQYFCSTVCTLSFQRLLTPCAQSSVASRPRETAPQP